MLKKIVMFIAFIIFIFLVVKGNSIVGYSGLAMMVIGLIGVVSELYIYNKKFQ